jgi:hypothetical protein
LFYPLKDAGVPYFIAHNSTFVGSALWHGFEPVYFLMLPEMIAAVFADELLLKYFPVDKMSRLGRVMYGAWIVGSMYTATSTFWYRTYYAFFFVRNSHCWSGTIMIFTVLIVMGAYSLIVGKPRSARSKKEE